MEGSHPQAFDQVFASDTCNPITHFPCSFVGERQCQDVEGIDPLSHDVSDAVGEDTGFT